MANTYTSLHYHVIFSTKDRHPWLESEIADRVWAYLGGIAKENGMKALLIGGTANHVHLLLGIPPTVAVSKAVQLLKGGSSAWIKGQFPTLAGFSWQDGYGAFTVSQSQVKDVAGYIAKQQEHHCSKTFEQEYREFLERHNLPIDERYNLG